MTDATPSLPVSAARQRARRLRATGVLVMAVGIVSAGVVYWLGARQADLSNDVSMLGFDRAEQRQMGRLYGKSGVLMDEWTNDLKQPGTQAFLILVISSLVTAGSFYFARLLDEDDEVG